MPAPQMSVCVYISLVFKYLTVHVCMNVRGCLTTWHRAKRMTQSWSSQCVCVWLFARPCGELALNVDVMLWPACCGTWPPLCTVSSTLRGSTIPQPPTHNTHHSIPQTTTEQNTTTPGTMSTQSFTRRKTLEPKLIKHSNRSNTPRQQAESNKGKHTSPLLHHRALLYHLNDGT